MKNNYNIKVNPPDLSSEQIAKHQDFDMLFAQFESTVVPPTTEQTEASIRPIDSLSKSSWVLKYGIGAMITIAAAVLLVFMMQQVVLSSGGTIPSEQMDEALALQAPMSDFEKPFSNLVVNAAENGETLEYHSGSKIIVPASAFVDEKGKAVKGKVDIQYREFNDHVDMFLAGVPKELDKHQNLQSVGMMEIKGFQDGKPVYLGMDKTLEVELKGTIAADIPTNDLGVYVYSKKQDAWDYTAADVVEVLAEVEQPKLNETQPLSEKELLAQAEKSLASSKPVRPIEPGVPSDMQTFDFDIDVNNFPKLAAYNQNVEFMAKLSDIKEGIFDEEWNAMKIEGLGEDKYQLILTREDNGVEIVQRLEVYPAIRATEIARQQYERDLITYHNKFNQWNRDVATAMTELMQGGDAVAKTNWKGIINKFTIHRFGLWNCGKTIEMQDEMQIGANFVDENGLALVVEKLFITNKNKQLYYFAPNADKEAFTPLKYDAKAENLIWALTDKNELLVANTKNPQPDGEKYTFQMKAAGIVQSEDDIRNLLTF